MIMLEKSSSLQEFELSENMNLARYLLVICIIGRQTRYHLVQYHT